MHEKSYTEIEYCKEIAKISAGTKPEEFAFKGIWEGADGDIVIEYETRGGYEACYNLDCADDIAQIKDLVADYLKEHPENELADKRIFFQLGEICCPPEPLMYATNYNWESGEFSSADDINYYAYLTVKDLSSLEKLGGAKRITVTAENIDSADFLSGWTELEYMCIQSHDWEGREDIKEKIAGLVDIGEITENDDYVFEFTVK